MVYIWQSSDWPAFRWSNDKALARHLELKDGAIETLTDLKQSGFAILVVSEGPHDAQELTIARLGLAPYVDLLVTSGQERRSKQEGLLKIALEKAGCLPKNCVFIGDNMECDILPALHWGRRHSMSVKMRKCPSVRPGWRPS